MQKDYIRKKLAVTRANNNISTDITGSDKNINRNEATNISEKNNEITIEIPDEMYIEEIQGQHSAHKTEENINEDARSIETIPETDNNTEDIQENIEESKNFDIFDELESQAEQMLPVINENTDDFENPEEAVSEAINEVLETFEHIAQPEQIAEAKPEEAIYPEHIEKHAEEPVVMPDYSSNHTEAVTNEPVFEYNEKLIAFDKAKAVEYAHRWALDRNPNFLDFDELGGDCTNYISQILLAGGCKMDHTPVYGWYYSSGSEKSPSWTGVEQHYTYLMKEKEHGVIAKEINAEEAQAGDIVQLSFNGRNFQHTPFIVEVSQTPDVPFHFDQIKICAHSFDSQNRALDTYQWRKIRFIRILGYLEK
jgi:hypothetical protein